MKYAILIVLLYFSITLQSSYTPISLNKNITFNNTDNLFEFNYAKNTSKDSLFLLYYEKTGDLKIVIDSVEADYYHYDYTIENDKGYIYFPCTEDNLTYMITFSDDFSGTSLKNDLKSTDEFSGNFKVLTSEFPIHFDFNEELEFDYLLLRSEVKYEFNPLILVLENKSDKDLMKKFEHKDKHKFNISMSENNEDDYKEIKNELLYFQKGKQYYIKIEFWEYEEDKTKTYYIYPFSINDFDINNVTMKEFSLGTMYNGNYQYVYTLINLNEYDSFDIKTFGGNPDINYVFLNDKSQLESFPKNMQYMNFSIMDSYKFQKPENTNYMILFIDYGELNVGIIFAKSIPMELNEVRQINETDFYFKLNYTKKNSKNEILYLFYDLENEENWVEIDSEKSSTYESYLRKKGTLDYLLKKNDEYYICFTSNPNVRGKFKVVSSEYEFSIDPKEELYIPKNRFKEYQGPIHFRIINIDKNYIKLFSPSDELKDTISYSKKDNEDFVSMENPLFLLEKEESIKIKVNVDNIESNFIHISNIDEKQVSDLSNKTYEFKNPLNQIFKINYLKTPYFELEGDESNNYYISYVTEDQYKKIPEGIDTLSFSKVTDNTLQKPDKFYYAVLISEIITNSNLTIKELEKPLNDLVYDSEQSFDSFKSNYKFKFQKAENKEMNLLLYKINENGQDFEIKVVAPDNTEKKESISSKYKNGIYAFELGEDGDYKLLFNSDKTFEGTFKLVNTSKEFKMNINEDVRYKSFTTDFKPSPIIMVFNIDEENPVVYKKLLVGDNNKQLDLVQISEGNSEEYKNLSLNLFAFEGGKEYKVKIDYNELENNKYKMEQFSMTDYNENNLEDFKFGTKKYNNNELNIIFLKIDFSNLTNNSTKIEVKVKKNKPKFKIAYHEDDANLTTIINDLTFEDFTDNCISEKSDNSYTKATLMIELNPGETEIEFKGLKEGEEPEKEGEPGENNDGNLTLILAIAIPVGIILILIIVFLICRCSKRKKADIEFKDDGQQKDEILMPETA